MLKQVREQRQTVGTLFPVRIASDAIEAGSSKLAIKATSHSAQIGDIIRLTSKSNLGVEYYVVGTEANIINLNAQLPCDASEGSTFDIYRLGTVLPDQMEYSILCEDTGVYFYLAEALPGTIAASSTWRVRRVNNSTVQVDWADGNNNFDNVASSLSTLAYS